MAFISRARVRRAALRLLTDVDGEMGATQRQVPKRPPQNGKGTIAVRGGAGARAFAANADGDAAAPAALDGISYGVDFDTTPIETALNWAAACAVVANVVRIHSRSGG